jgi:nitrogen fixation protein FixH
MRSVAMRDERVRSLTGRSVLLVLLAFFGVTLLANGALVFTALESWSGLTGPRPYERGLAYNRALEAARAQSALGWQVKSDFAATGPRAGMLSVEARDATGVAIEGAVVRAFIVRPTQTGHDFDVELTPREAGRYGRAVVFPLAGQWQVSLEIAAGGHIHRTAMRIRVE